MNVDASTKSDQINEAQSARARRTKTAIADAMIALVLEGSGFPRVHEIAKRANVGVRTVFHHFGDTEKLYGEIIRRLEPKIAGLIVAIDPHDELDQRVRALVTQRHQLFCRLSPLRRAARGRADLARSYTVRTAKQRLHYVLDRQVHETFANELRTLPDRHGAVLRIAAALSFELWEHLTRERGLSGAQVQRHLSVLVMRELAN